jgi:hypothetical protein
LIGTHIDIDHDNGNKYGPDEKSAERAAAKAQRAKDRKEKWEAKHKAKQENSKAKHEELAAKHKAHQEKSKEKGKEGGEHREE